MIATPWAIFQTKPKEFNDWTAIELVRKVSEHLAYYWLNDEILEMAIRYQESRGRGADSLKSGPPIPGDAGLCTLLLASIERDGDAPEMPALKSAIPFPVVWDRSSSGKNDRRLPSNLLCIADKVRDVIGKALNDNTRVANMFLRPPKEWDKRFPNLSSLPFTFESAFASLAAGLLVASAGGRANSEVMASACWSDEAGFQQVSGLEEKAILAKRLGCKALFVARNQNTSRSEHLANDRFKIERDLTNESDVLRAFQTFRKQLFVEPEKTDDFPVRRQYYVDVLRNDRNSAKFYRNKLLEDVTARCRDFLGNGEALPKYEYGVAWVSQTPELVLLMEAVYQPNKLLLFYTGADRSIERHARWLRDKCFPGRCELIDMPDDERMVDTVREALEVKLRGVIASSVVVDLTPGWRFMTIALMNAAPRGCRLSVAQSQTNSTKAALPGTERFVVWNKAAEPEDLIVRTTQSM